MPSIVIVFFGCIFNELFVFYCCNLENNTYSLTPVKSSFGYHIIYRKNQSEKPTLDDNLKQKIMKVLSEEITPTTPSSKYTKADSQKIFKMLVR